MQLLWQQLQAQKASACHTEASLSNCVIDLATRKSYGVKQGQLLNMASFTLHCTMSCTYLARHELESILITII